jgi:hypothetical protein
MMRGSSSVSGGSAAGQDQRAPASRISVSRAYGPYVRGLAFGAIRRGQALRQRDPHNLVGVATLGWTLGLPLFGGPRSKVAQRRSLHDGGASRRR